MHFPIEVLKDQIKDLFEHSVPKEIHDHSFEFGLSHALKFHHSDKIVQQSADQGEGYEENGQYAHFINLYDNYVQFLWMLTYSILAGYDYSQMILTSPKELRVLEYVQSLREAEEVYREALNMTAHNEVDSYMKASRGKLFRLPNPYSKKNEYIDKTNSIVIYSCAYLLLHEYAHFYYEHEEDTPANENKADEFAIDKLLAWASKQDDRKRNISSMTIGIILSLVCASYVNPTLVSSSYPDIDDRIERVINSIQNVLNSELNETVYEVLWRSYSDWCKNKSHLDVHRDCSLSAKENLCRAKTTLAIYKRQYRV